MLRHACTASLQRWIYCTLLKQGKAGQSVGRGRTESRKAAGGEGFGGIGSKDPSSMVLTTFPAAVPGLLHPCGTVMEKIIPNHLVQTEPPIHAACAGCRTGQPGDMGQRQTSLWVTSLRGSWCNLTASI